MCIVIICLSSFNSPTSHPVPDPSHPRPRVEPRSTIRLIGGLLPFYLNPSQPLPSLFNQLHPPSTWWPSSPSLLFRHADDSVPLHKPEISFVQSSTCIICDWDKKRLPHSLSPHHFSKVFEWKKDNSQPSTLNQIINHMAVGWVILNRITFCPQLPGFHDIFSRNNCFFFQNFLIFSPCCVQNKKVNLRKIISTRLKIHHLWQNAFSVLSLMQNSQMIIEKIWKKNSPMRTVALTEGLFPDSPQKNMSWSLLRMENNSPPHNPASTSRRFEYTMKRR